MEHAETKRLEHTLARGPVHLPRDETALLRHYTLSGDDIEHIRVRRERRNRLSFALQLCPFRYPGRLLAAGEAIPLNGLRFVAAQLGMRAEDPMAMRCGRRHGENTSQRSGASMATGCSPGVLSGT